MNKKVLILVGAWLVIANLFALVSLNRFNVSPDTAYSWINPKELLQTKGIDLIDLHSRWDSFWYLDIAKNGYIYKGEGQLSNIVFFPLYPMLIKIASFITLGNYELAGWLVSIVCLGLGSNYLYKLVSRFHPQIDPKLTLIFMLIFPTAFFFNSIYSESLFLFLSVACFYYALSRNYLAASIFGFFAAFSRFTGFLLFIPIIFEYLDSQNFKLRLTSNIIFSLLVPLGAVLFFLFHQLAFGDFTLFLKVEQSWGRAFNINYEHFQLATNPAVVNFILDASYILLIFVAIFFVFKKLRVSYGLYMLGTVLIVLSTGTFMSIGRYILVLFPLYILFASVKNEYLRFVISTLFVLLLGMEITLFVNNYWAG